MKKKLSHAQHEELVAFVQELFFDVDDFGSRKHSYSDIIAEIKKKFNVTYSRTTIQNWATQYGWTQAIKQRYVEKFSNVEQNSEIWAKKFERNLDGMFNITSRLENRILTILDSEAKVSHKVIFETYERLISSNAKILESFYKYKKEVLAIEKEQEESQAGFDCLLQKLTQEAMAKIKTELEETANGKIEDADYEIIGNDDKDS